MRKSWLLMVFTVTLIGGAWCQNPTINSLTVSPLTVTFTGNNPGGTVTASSPVVITANVNKANPSNNWNFTVQANSSTLSGAGCPNSIPVTDIVATCSAASATGKNSSAACNSTTFNLSTTSQQFVNGTEGTTGPTHNYTATLTFTLPDKWAYIATTGATCSVQLSYTASFF